MCVPQVWLQEPISSFSLKIITKKKVVVSMATWGQLGACPSGFFCLLLPALYSCVPLLFSLMSLHPLLGPHIQSGLPMPLPLLLPPVLKSHLLPHVAMATAFEICWREPFLSRAKVNNLHVTSHLLLSSLCKLQAVLGGLHPHAAWASSLGTQPTLPCRVR